MSILSREKEIAHTQNQIKHSTCTVYTASPEELEQLLNGRNGMGRRKSSKNKPRGITIDEKRLALQSKIENQKTEMKDKTNEIFENLLSSCDDTLIQEMPDAATENIGSIETKPTPWLTLNKKLDDETADVNDVDTEEPSEIHQRCMNLLKQKHKLACIEAAHKLISDEIRCLGIENSVETLSNIIEIAITIRKELLVQ